MHTYTGQGEEGAGRQAAAERDRGGTPHNDGDANCHTHTYQGARLAGRARSWPAATTRQRPHLTATTPATTCTWGCAGVLCMGGLHGPRACRAVYVPEGLGTVGRGRKRVTLRRLEESSSMLGTTASGPVCIYRSVCSRGTKEGARSAEGWATPGGHCQCTEDGWHVCWARWVAVRAGASGHGCHVQRFHAQEYLTPALTRCLGTDLSCSKMPGCGSHRLLPAPGLQPPPRRH